MSVLVQREAAEIREEWLGWALSTLPADRQAAEAAISGLYRLIWFRRIHSPPPPYRCAVTPKGAGLYDHPMRAGYGEALTMLGYVLGAVAATMLGGWAAENRWELPSETMTMAALLFQVAFFFGLVRLAFRGVRSLARTSVRARTSARRWRTPNPEEPS